MMSNPKTHGGNRFFTGLLYEKSPGKCRQIVKPLSGEAHFGDFGGAENFFMNYTIQRGDTLSALARRFGTTVQALAQANGIQNVNLIYAGANLRVPGRSDEFGPRPPSGPRPDDGFTPGPGGSSRALDIARANLGKNAGTLKLEGSPVGRAMEDWVPNNVNCASFVSACLEAAGQINHSDYSARCTTLMANLDRNPRFQRVSIANAKPGDVVTFKTPGGHHTVIYAGMQNGRPLYIGSNNINPDGTQRISYSHFNYPILAVHHFRG